MFYRRGFNIRTLTVGSTHEPELTKMVVRVGNRRTDLERLMPSIGNLVDVLAVQLSDVAEGNDRELCLVRVQTVGATERGSLLAAVAPFRPRLVDTGDRYSIVEMADTSAALDEMLAALAPFRVLDVSRTGTLTVPGNRAPSLRNDGPTRNENVDMEGPSGSSLP
jgi:acetolactate synthase-1/3 small subunit